jgi:hypothetical protein
MLAELQFAMKQLHHGRRRRLRALAATAFIVVGSGVTLAVLSSTRVPLGSGGQAAPHVAEAPPILELPDQPLMDNATARPPDPMALIQLISTDTRLLSITRFAARTYLIERIDDDSLLSVLASVDRETGLVRRGDVVEFTHPVTDDEVRKQDNPSSSAARDSLHG